MASPKRSHHAHAASSHDATPTSLAREPSFSFNPLRHETSQAAVDIDSPTTADFARAHLPPRRGGAHTDPHGGADPATTSGEFAHAVGHLGAPTHTAPVDNTVVAAAATNSNYSARVMIGLDRVLVVHFCATDKGQGASAADQLLSSARVAIPAILNYLYFRASKVAVVYLGKTRREDGLKVGVEGGDDLKRKMIRFMTTEVWPPLRTDVPDDSQPTAGAASATAALMRKKSTILEFRARRSDMQALIYLKPAANDTSYVKLVLTGSDQLHFDITDHRDEKHRWENRKLHIRMLDSLETQKAIFSYEEYEKAFRSACAFCLEHGDALDSVCLGQTVVAQFHAPPAGSTPVAPPTSLSAPSSAAAALASSPPSAAPAKTQAKPAKRPGSEWFGPMRTSYGFFERLDKPESATLDYKSYFSNPVQEILDKATKFMCGFLNAYGYGRLVVGVHEMPLKVVLQAKEEEAARAVSPSLGTGLGASLGSDSPPTVTTPPPALGRLQSRGKDDDNEQIVIGVSVTPEDIELVQTELSAQLQQCVPPIPPSAVRVDCVPIALPASSGPVFVLIFFEQSASTNWKDLFRQKSNSAIRSLSRHHMSMCPIPFDDRVRALVPVDAQKVQCFAIINSPQQWTSVKTPLVCAGDFASSLLDAPFVAIEDDAAWAATKGGDDDESEDAKPRDEEREEGGGRKGKQQRGRSGRSSSKNPTASATANRSFDATRPLWWVELEYHLPQVKGSRNHVIAELEGKYELPQLYIVDISVNCNRMGELWKTRYDRGKFFNGWPSIPVWDTNNHEVTRLERHYDIFSARSLSHLVPGSRCWWKDVAVVPIIIQYLFGIDVDPKKRSVCASVAEADSLSHRRVCASFNEQYQTLQGMDLLAMLQQWSSKGSLLLKCTYAAVREMQSALKFSRLSMMPLLLAWTYQVIGTLPAPFPFAPVPLALQPLRPAPFLIPIYYKTAANACSLALHVALDSRDGVLKRVVLSKDRTCVDDLVPVRGVGFALIANTELSAFRRKQQEAIDAEQRRTSVRTRRMSRLPITSNLGSMPAAPAAMTQPITEAAPSIHFRFMTPADAVGNVPWSLKNLLLWLQSVVHNPSIKMVGHCNRSFAFVCDLVTEVCPVHFQPAAAGGDGRWLSLDAHGDALQSSPPHTPTTSEPGRAPSMSPTSTGGTSVRYPAIFDCALHKAEYEWAQWE